jgi:hypothetical protein
MLLAGARAFLRDPFVIEEGSDGLATAPYAAVSQLRQQAS